MSLGEQVPEIRFSEKWGDAGKSSKALHVKNYQKSNVKKLAKIEICYALPLAHFHGTAFGYPKPGLREHCTCNTTK